MRVNRERGPDRQLAKVHGAGAEVAPVIVAVVARKFCRGGLPHGHDAVAEPRRESLDLRNHPILHINV